MAKRILARRSRNLREAGWCLGGCLGTIAVLIVLAIIAVGAGWYFYEKFAREYTSPHSIDVHIPPPTSAEIRHAESALNELHAALAGNETRTIRFSARDINTLISTSPDFDEMRNRVRVDISDSLLFLEMSVPLTQTQLPKLRDRWFNGQLECAFSYTAPNFIFVPKDGMVAGRPLPSWILSRRVATSFSEQFTRGFRKSLEEREGENTWEHIKRIDLQGNELIITTQPSSEPVGQPSRV